MNWRFWRKKPQFEWDQWLDKQSAWMKETLTFLDTHFPDKSKDLRVRLELMLMNHNTNTPIRVTEVIVAELKDIEENL